MGGKLLADERQNALGPPVIPVVNDAFQNVSVAAGGHRSKKLPDSIQTALSALAKVL